MFKGGFDLGFSHKSQPALDSPNGPWFPAPLSNNHGRLGAVCPTRKVVLQNLPLSASDLYGCAFS